MSALRTMGERGSFEIDVFISMHPVETFTLALIGNYNWNGNSAPGLSVEEADARNLSSGLDLLTINLLLRIGPKTNAFQPLNCISNNLLRVFANHRKFTNHTPPKNVQICHEREPTIT